jgi:large subunit ribosomal protein L15
LLGKGELKTKLDFEVDGASKSAVAAVEKQGGTVKVLRKEKPVAEKNTAKGKTAGKEAGGEASA